MAVSEATVRSPARCRAAASRAPWSARRSRSWHGGTGALVTFGYSDDEAFAVGLTCGGTIHLLIEPLGGPGVPSWSTVRDLSRHEPLGLATVVEGTGRATGCSSGPTAGRRARWRTRPRPGRHPRRLAELARADPVRHYGACGEANEETVTVFIESFAPPPRMLVFGAVDFTAALARAAKVLGYHVTVCDAREVFATKARFPMADEVVVDWPNRFLAGSARTSAPRTPCACSPTTPSSTCPRSSAALATKVGYLGVMGSRGAPTTSA